jgi:hypothetical protein
MRWMITRDCYGDDPGAVGTGNFKGDSSGLPHEFRLYTDDDELMYEGRSDDADTEDAFRPLDWAAYRAGCTYIQYRQDGRWQTL